MLRKTLKSNQSIGIRSPIIVLGLGNPGERFEGSRHNVGYLVVDNLLNEPPKQEPPKRLRRRLFSSYAYAELPVELPMESAGESQARRLVLVRYAGYMNRSGEIINPVLKRFSASPADLLVIVDNMDLAPGLCRLKKGGGDAGHNGMKSLIGALGRGDFMRLYVGVGRPSAKISVINHVLGNATPEDQRLIDSAVLRASAAVRLLASRSFERVAEELNRRDS